MKMIYIFEEQKIIFFIENKMNSINDTGIEFKCIKDQRQKMCEEYFQL